MQELVGRLTALDAEATETLKVIAYFDALVDGHASTDVLLRGAAILSGCGAGAIAGRTEMRVDATGARSPVTRGDWPSRTFGDDGIAWIERSGPAHANDEMILERLAIALSIAWERTSAEAATRRALQTLIDPASTVEARLAAARSLKLSTQSLHRIVARAVDDSVRGPSVTVPTRVGMVRVSVYEQSEPVDGERAGIGVAKIPDHLGESWASALAALRLTSTRTPTVHADELGVLLLLVEAADRLVDAGQDAPSDVCALSELVRTRSNALDLLECIASTDSLRSVASECGLHHSTVQARAAAFSDALGFDIRVPHGRTRLALALAMHSALTNRFDVVSE
ncbi:helix-turn-helix domain-containing protein [Microbacterium lacus]|uniref:helix-turn-helix domain-containing protein n=1 Tax=Microbacterium lacus TaxID=415217 RepID=UPI00384CDBDB